MDSALQLYECSIVNVDDDIQFRLSKKRPRSSDIQEVTDRAPKYIQDRLQSSLVQARFLHLALTVLLSLKRKIFKPFRYQRLTPAT